MWGTPTSGGGVTDGPSPCHLSCGCRLGGAGSFPGAAQQPKGLFGIQEIKILPGAGAQGQPEELEAVLCLCMSVPGAGDMLWQCLNKVSSSAWDPLALTPCPSCASQGITQPQQCPTAPALGTGGAPVPSATPLVRAAPGWHSLWERGGCRACRRGAVNHPAALEMLQRKSKTLWRYSLDAVRGIPQVKNPAAAANSCLSLLITAPAWPGRPLFPGSVPSLGVRGAAGCQEALGTSSSSSRKS